LEDPVINLIIATILGVLTTILVDKVRERIKRLWWGVKNSIYATNYFGKDGEFSISQSGHKKVYRKTTRDLSICRFVFWSSGNEILQDNDISRSEPLTITFDNKFDIVRIEKIVFSNPTIQVSIINLHQIAVTFEYLEAGEGAVFDIFYAGNDAQPLLFGVIKGGKISIKKMNPPDDLIRAPAFQLLFGWLKPVQQIISLKWFFTISFIFMFIALFMFLTWLPITLSSEDLTVKILNILWIARIALVTILSINIGIELWKLVVVPLKLRRYYEKLSRT